MDKSTCKTINDVLIKLWKNKTHYIRKSVILNSYNKGGLNFINFDSLNNRFKINWLKQYLSKPTSIWNTFPQLIFSRFGGLHFLLMCNYDISKLPIKLSNFHRQALLAWTLIYKHNFSPQRCFIWNNKNKSLYYANWFSNGLVLVQQLFNNQGLLLRYSEFLSKYQIPITSKEFAVVMGAIPSGLCMLLKNCRYSSTVTASFPNPCDTPVGQICFSESRNKNYRIRSLFLENLISAPHVKHFWNNLFDNLNWKKSMVFNQVSLFLSQNNILDTKQSGFRSGHSTETALLSVTEALRIAKANSKSSVLILLDLSAAFDTVNHQILLSTLSSLDITGIPLRWFESYLTGRSFRVAWGGEVSKAHKLVTVVPQGSVLGPLLFSTYTTSLAPIIQAHGFSYHFYADDTQLYLSFRPDDPTVAARISGCLADISAWMKEHHLQLNLAKTELLVFPATPTLQHDFTIQLGSSTITPSASVRNLGVIFDDQLTFKEHIAKTARSCRFALHNIRKIRPFLTEHAAQLLVQALVISRLDYCNALLAGLPSNTIKPLQMIQNAAARLVFNEPKRAHVTPLFVSLHWLPVAAHIQFKTLMLAYRTITGSAPTYFHSLLRTYIPSRSLRSASERRLVVPSQRGSKSLSRTFSFTVPGRWNDLPTPIRNAGSLSIFKQQLKTHLFQLYLTT